MEKGDLVGFVDRGLSTREIARESSLSQITVRYWLKKHGLKTKYKPYRRDFRSCNKCFLCEKEVSRRKLCPACYQRVRRYRVKRAAVKLLGGKCVECGWRGDLAGYEFHHDQGDKEFQIGSASNRSWKVVKVEVVKCELLCSNCHRVKHSKHDDERLKEALRLYQGKDLN